MNDIRLNGQVAIVTGAGGGLGRSHAIELARRGAQVLVNDLGGDPGGNGVDATRAESVAAEIRDLGGQAVANHDSVSTPEGGSAIVRAAVEAFGTIDVVVNNAGFLRDAHFGDVVLDDLDAIVDVHLKAAFHVSQPAFHIMRAKGYGRFIHTASPAGLFGRAGTGGYAAAKAGLVGLSNVIGIEGKPAGIQSNVIAPLARSRLTEHILGAQAATLGPDHVAALVAYLAARECAVSQEVFVVGGGHIARAFIGLTPGWHAEEGGSHSAEEILANIDAIMSTDGFTIPETSAEAIKPLMA